MNRLILLAFGLLVIALLILAVPIMIGALPDRYVMRIPKPFQKYGLPENTVALLPTVDSPLPAATLLASHPAAPRSAQAATMPAQNTVVRTPQSTETQAVVTLVATAQMTETPTASPSPSPSPEPTVSLPPIPENARLEGFQHVFQTWNNCGPATLAMALSYFGDRVTQDQTAAVLKPNPEDRNVSPQEMASYVNEETGHSALWRANGTLDMLRRLIAAGVPVIIETGIEPPGEFRWLGWYGHYLLLVAYDDLQGNFWVYDSWFGTSEEPLQNANPDGRILTYEELAEGWPQFNRNFIALFDEEQSAAVSDIVGEAMTDARMWEIARDRALADIETNPENAFYWFNLGTNNAALGNYEDAAGAFDQARAIGLPWRMLWYQFGPYEAYLNTGRYEDVVLLADVTLEDRPYFEESYYYRGLALAELGDHDAAVNNLEQAVRFNPNFSPAQQAMDWLQNRADVYE
ncbi:MAG: C39 family peptidase [Candidatus Promineifilaceae bacterium]